MGQGKVKSKKSSGFFSAQSFVDGFTNNALGVVGFVAEGIKEEVLSIPTALAPPFPRQKFDVHAATAVGMSVLRTRDGQSHNCGRALSPGLGALVLASWPFMTCHVCQHDPNRPPLRAQDNFQVRMDREKELLAKVAAKKAAKDAAKR